MTNDDNDIRYEKKKRRRGPQDTKDDHSNFDTVSLNNQRFILSWSLESEDHQEL